MAFYKDGVISIPNVTGDVVITASAVAQAPHYTNLYDETKCMDNYRINSSRQIVALNGAIVLNPIQVNVGDVIRCKNIGAPEFLAAVFPTDTDTAGSDPHTQTSYDSTTKVFTAQIGKMGDITDHYYRIAIYKNKIEGDIIITKNEEIPS